MSILSRLYVYPVKSMHGLQLSHALVESEELAFDRVFMLTDADSFFIVARQYPQMLLFIPVMLTGSLHLIAPDSQIRHVLFTDCSLPTQLVEVWWSNFTAYLAPESINTWLSGYLKQPFTLFWTGEYSHRWVKRFQDILLSFADDYLYLLISEASFLDLQRCCSAVGHHQFRPKLMVADTEAYEDSWYRLGIGEAEFEVITLCNCCVLTTVNVEQGHKHPVGNPLCTLQGCRSVDNGNIDFGKNVIVSTTCIVRVSDNVEVFSARKLRRYRAVSPANTATPPPLTDGTPVTIVYQGRQFIGNQQDILLEQLELHGIRIPYSCRAGICGICKVKLLSGYVTPLTSSATASVLWILSCSCLPRGDIHLE